MAKQRPSSPFSDQDRRQFLKKIALGGGAVLVGNRLMGAPVKTGGSDKLGPIMATRPFGKTGERVTIFCLGGSHVVKAPNHDEDPQAIIEKSLEEGVRFFDNAVQYGRGRAEELYGQYLTPKYRDSVFLMTKTLAKTKSEAESDLADSFRRMKTDYVDLWLIHSVTTAKDVERRLQEGVLEAFLEAKQSGKARYIGFSGHRLTEAHLKMIESVSGNDPFDYIQMPINAVDTSKPDSFVQNALPKAVERGYAIGAMKTLGHGRFFGNASTDKLDTDDPVIPNNVSLEEALWYVLAQPVTSIVSGNDRMSYLTQNLEIVKRFTSLSQDDQMRIVAKLEKFRMTPNLEWYRPNPNSLV